MKLKIILAVTTLAASLSVISCGGGDKKKDDSKGNTETTVGPTKSADDGTVPKINIGSLKDEASILDAMQKVVDARIADEKKQKEDPNYAGHYIELNLLYTDVLNASTAYTKTIADPAKAVEFSNKLNAIQDKMYAK